MVSFLFYGIKETEVQSKRTFVIYWKMGKGSRQLEKMKN